MPRPGSDAFQDVLRRKGVPVAAYMRRVRSNAQRYFARWRRPPPVQLCADGKHKLQVWDEDAGRWVRFGDAASNDFLVYGELEAQGQVPRGTANAKRRAYLARASAIPGQWATNRLSPNMLAMNILWR